MNGKRAALFVVAGTLALVSLLLTAAGAWAAPRQARDAAPSLADPISHTISYQGYLTDAGGQPVSGIEQLTFSFYVSATSDKPSFQQTHAVNVENGLFTTQLGVDARYFGGALWLGIQVQGDPEELAPRQPLLPAPYALYALGAPWSGLTGVPAGIADTWRLGGNAGTTYGADVLGTLDPVSLTLAVSNTPALRLEYTSADSAPNVVAGAAENSAAPGSVGNVIAGGGWADGPNRVTSYHNYGAVGGGISNTMSGSYGVIGGGISNTVGLGTSAVVAGGGNNKASGNYSIVAGGIHNTTLAAASFAGGQEANTRSIDTGSFVWSSGGPTYSCGAHTFTARAPGGVRFYSADSGTASGVQLSPGGSAFLGISDRNAKESFQDVDMPRLLQTLAGLPIQTWNLKAQDPAIRHIGPVAQDFGGDFFYLFGQVEDPHYINSGDETGIALAAAQGLYDLSQQQASEIADLQTQNEALQSENAAQAQQIEALQADNTSLQAQLADLAARVAALEGDQ